MQPITTMLRRTTHQVNRQREAFALHARKATGTIVGETREASRELAAAVRNEADAWSKFARETTSVATGNLAPTAIERTLLLRVSLALRALDARLRQRLDSISGRKRSLRSSKAKRANGVTKSRVKRQAVAARAN